MQAIGATPESLALAIQPSSLLQLNEDHTRVRGIHCAAMLLGLYTFFSSLAIYFHLFSLFM